MVYGVPARSIVSFDDLATKFVSQFAANKDKQLEVADLFDIRQMPAESLKKYLARFNKATMEVKNSDQKLFMKAFMKGLHLRSFSRKAYIGRRV